MRRWLIIEKNKDFKIIGFVEVAGHKIPLTCDYEVEHYLTEHPNLIKCPNCGKKVYGEDRIIGHNTAWDIPITEQVYSPLVIEKEGKLQCRGCKFEWLPP